MTGRTASDAEACSAIIEACRWMNASGINQGTSGNISVRMGQGDRMLITPSGIPYERLTPDMLVELPIEGEAVTRSAFKPSTEWRFHRALLAAKPEMSAVVHAHPVHATAISMQRRRLEAVHYMIGAFGGNTVELADYHIFGSEDLASAVRDAMRNRHACLMCNHGAVVVGESLERALWRMVELETLARLDLLSRIGGLPVVLNEEQMREVLREFAEYGPGATARRP